MLRNSFMVRLVVCIIGILLISSSSALFYCVNMGSDPYQTLVIAVHRVMDIRYGMANTLLNLLLIGIIFIAGKKYINLAMVLVLMLSGTIIDFLQRVIQNNFAIADSSLLLKVLIAFLGCILLALGVVIYTFPKLGASPADGVGLIISEKLNIPYAKIRIATDIFFLAIGILLNGQIGIVSIMTVAFTGPFIGMFSKALSASSSRL